MSQQALIFNLSSRLIKHAEQREALHFTFERRSKPGQSSSEDGLLRSFADGIVRTGMFRPVPKLQLQWNDTANCYFRSRTPLVATLNRFTFFGGGGVGGLLLKWKSEQK